MTINLPPPIARYFDTDKSKDADAIAQCFTGGAIVRDERNTYVGRDSIRRWKEQSSKKYTYSVEPFAIAVDKVWTDLEGTLAKSQRTRRPAARAGGS